jgi:hypothetical protein
MPTNFLSETLDDMTYGEFDQSDLDLFAQWARTVPPALLPLWTCQGMRELLGAAYYCLCWGESIPEEFTELGPLVPHLTNYFKAHRP